MAREVTVSPRRAPGRACGTGRGRGEVGGRRGLEADLGEHEGGGGLGEGVGRGWRWTKARRRGLRRLCRELVGAGGRRARKAGSPCWARRG